VFKSQHDLGPYLETRAGGTLQFGRRLADFLTVSLRYRFEALQLRDISPSASIDVFRSRGPDEISSLTGEIAVDFTERAGMGQPYSGFESSVSYEYAGGGLFGSIDFHKAQWEAAIYRTVFGEVSEWRHILSIRARVGWAAPHHHAWDLPVYERFYLGGLGTLRGFGYRGVGPRQQGSPVGGDFRVYGGVEYSLPLYRAPMPGTWRQEIDVLRLVVFYDVGALSSTLDDYSTRIFRSGLGFGFRLMVPALGGVPISLDFGWPVSRQPGDDTERVSFSLGWFF